MFAALRRIAGYDTRIIEVLHAALLVAWAVVLLTPPPLFSTASMHARMAAMGGEWEWGLVVVATLAVVVAGIITDKPSWRRAGSMTGVIWWGTVSVSGILSAPGASGPWVYLIVTHFLGWAYIKGRL